jgi:tetratricopeptide (TPR) repeat protein
MERHTGVGRENGTKLAARHNARGESVVNVVDSQSNKAISWWLVLIHVLVFAGLGLYIVEPLLFPPPLPAESESISATVEDARAALLRDNYALAETLSREIILENPAAADAYLIAGEAAVKFGDVEAALAYYGAVPKTAREQYVTSRWSMGNVVLYQGKLREAELLFRETLELDPTNIVANERLAFILGVEGRRWESIPYLLEPIRQGSIFMEPLLLLSTVDSRNVEHKQIIEESRKVNPDDWVPLLGPARIKTFGAKFDEAEAMLREILQHAPNQVEAHALLGRILVERGDAEKYRAWSEGLPAGAERHPDIWFAQGMWAQNHEDPEGAARCYWETIRINPDHQKANYRLSRLLVALGKNQEAEPFGKRAESLERLLQVLAPLYDRREHRPEGSQMITAAELSESLGRLWEALAWYSLVLVVDPTNAVAKKGTDRLRPQTAGNPPLTLPDANPANKIDLSSLRLPTWKTIVQSPKQAAETPTVAPRFVNVAAEAGLDFTYNNGDDPAVAGVRLCQQNGGAMAVLDYDLDGWPDLYVSQGGPWPADPQQTTYRDRLFRNLGNGKFVDVTDQANLGDNLYSQGAAVGDFDNDGWPDLFVANLGPNRLYHNEGDGTFTDVTQGAGITGEVWSTSCLIADLNGDSWPDIYIVNYLSGKECLEAECFDAGEKRACSPGNFPAEQDQLLLSQGDGRFVDVTQESGIVAPDGKGLGVVAADFHGAGKLSLYVSNDTTANFYFVNQAAKRGDPPQFQETGLLSGLAVDRDGTALASMGIAVGDGDEDGLLDLFVTNFYMESNTYYRQISPDFFEDTTQAMGLRDASLPMLSFGTQFIDFELDGRLDLIVANGHVDDFRYKGTPYKMRPQAFANRGNGRFVELDPRSMGPFFEGEYLGRSVALLDWDRDGKEDFAMLLLYEPSALLVNRTPTTGHYLHLHLRGVQCERDAIGTTVHATVRGRRLVRQLIAGNGFQCSSQRTVHFGVGDAARIDQLVVKWPSGVEQTFDNVPVDREVILLEGAAQLVEVPRDMEN